MNNVFKNNPPHCLRAAKKTAIIPVVPIPTGHTVLPQTGQTLFIERAPAKIDHHPAKRNAPVEIILLINEKFPDSLFSVPFSGIFRHSLHLHSWRE